MSDSRQLVISEQPEEQRKGPNNSLLQVESGTGVKSTSSPYSASPSSSFGISITGNELKDNEFKGDVVLGVKLNLTSQTRNPNALLDLLERSRQLTEESNEYRAMIEELQSFLAPRPGRQIVGLEYKLNDGQRPDLIDDALWLESRFVRRLAREQHSTSYQALFLHCLSQINSAFCAYIHPLIRSGAHPAAVDSALKNLVIDPLYQDLMSVDCSLTADMVRGMLYFLTGKCHLQWK